MRSSLATVRWLDAMAVAALVAFAAYLTDPVARGVMPLSADHTVHLTRIHLWQAVLADGHLRGFRPEWGFGVPIGEFYPILGDALILLLHLVPGVGLRLAYALGFFAVFAFQGVAAYLCARLCGVGRLGALLAGMAILGDVGAYREGGFVYTVTYGVWPQAFATSLALLGLSLAARWMDAERPPVRTGIGAAVSGACALLAHPMALLVLAIFGAALVAVRWAGVPREGVRVLLRAGCVFVLAVALAAFFLGPMVRFRGYMASYGWLGPSMHAMVAMLLRGSFAQGVVPPATLLALLGLASATCIRRSGLRAIAIGTLACWVLATREAFWDLRLDLLSPSFAHVQFQRFLAVAKFGGYVLAGFGADRILRAVTALGRGRRAARVVGIVLVSAIVTWVAAAQLGALRRAGPAARVQVERYPGNPGRTADWADLARAMERLWAERDGFFRFAARAPRNAHDLVDLVVETGAPVYKMGFTPGDNFVHKPESGRPEVLDALGVRYVIERVRSGRPSRRDALHFGAFRLRPRQGSIRPVAWIEGPGAVHVDTDDRFAPYVRGRIEGADEGSRIVFAIAGHPRFRLTMNGEPVAWVETPIYGDAPDVTPEDRLAGRVRGGKAHGDDGSEPILVAAPARNGSFELTYDHALPFDWAMGVLSLLACGLVVFAGLRADVAERALGTLEAHARRRIPVAVPGVLVVLLVAATGLRYARAARAHADHLHARASADPAHGVRVGPAKVDMWIRPAVFFAPREGRPARLVLSDLPPGRYTGFRAIEDDPAKMRPKGRLEFLLRIVPPEGPPTEIRAPVRHRPGSVPLSFDVPSGARLEIEVTAHGTPPPLVVDLWPEESP
ncbi:MAG: hypothetical protein D6705_11715 [Deltaproteobacteria bacterium]|nr:MAG: hypothetical protein D6705_11715 [Deltaproteobacteria bacterium]